ncbi:MAG: RidA family protein [Oscillospiraceae bacterium]|nr:RidA family protein [Oscillospiraceae bacterium]
MKIEKKLEELGIKIPEVSPPKAKYVPVRRVGNLLFVSGQLPVKEDGTMYTGKVGKEHDIESGQAAARRCAITMLATLKAELGDLDLIKGFVKLQSFVSSEVGFDQQHIVTNAASELFLDVFGEAGKHARTAVGTNQLPMDATVEIEAIIEV